MLVYVMDIPTHKKGDIAVGKVISDLLSRGWYVFAPLSTHACHYDLIASKYCKFKKKDVVLRLQVKCNYVGYKKYRKILDAFDLYAVYYEHYERVVYISHTALSESSQNSFRITNDLPNSMTPFYWWEDFTDISVRNFLPKKKSVRDFNYKIKLPSTVGTRSSPISNKISKLKLQKLLWRKSMVRIASELNVSDRSLGKYVIKHNLIKPPTGYWAKSKTGKLKVRKRYAKIVKDRLKELL